MKSYCERTSLRISPSRFWMQSSFLFRQRWAAMRFLLRRRMSWINSSCSEVSLCILMRIWKSLRGRFVMWSTGKGSFTWKKDQRVIHSTGLLWHKVWPIRGMIAALMWCMGPTGMKHSGFSLNRTFVQTLLIYGTVFFLMWVMRFISHTWHIITVNKSV